MRERVELLLGRSTRAMWVMTFHSACARILRAEAPRLGYTRAFTIYDQSDSRRLVKRCIDELGVDLKRFTPAAMHNQISDAKNKLRDAEAYRQLVGGYFEQTVADVYELYERELHRMNAMDFDDLLFRVVNVLELFPEVRARYAAAFRHVLVDEYQDTNHAQYRLLQLLAGGAPQPDGRRRRRAVDLRLPRRRHPQHPRLPGRLPRRAKVVKLEQNYRSTQTILDAANAVIATTASSCPRRSGPSSARATRSWCASSTTSTPRRATSSGQIERLVDEGVSRAEIAVFYRTNAQSRVLEDIARAPRDPLPGGRRHEVLRARRGQGRDRLPDGARQPGRRDLLHAHRQLAAARDRADVAVARDRATRRRWACRSGTSPPTRLPCPGLGTAAVKAFGPLHGHDGRAACARAETACRSATCSRRSLHETGYLDALEAERTIEAQGRIENLEELVEVAREFDARGRGRDLGAFLQQIALVADADTRRTTRAS